MPSNQVRSNDVDPGFTDPANGDFSLSGTSLALGKGVASWDTYIDLTAPLYDIVGNERPAPSGSSPDLGAYEGSGSSAEPEPGPGDVERELEKYARLNQRLNSTDEIYVELNDKIQANVNSFSPHREIC